MHITTKKMTFILEFCMTRSIDGLQQQAVLPHEVLHKGAYKWHRRLAAVYVHSSCISGHQSRLKQCNVVHRLLPRSASRVK